MKSCAFTGHRPQNLPFGFREDDERCTALKETLKKQIISLITDENVTHFISGMALGVDMYAAEIVLELKKTYPGITLESAIPCETQAAKWNAAMRERYYGIAAQCDKETLLQTHYTPDCMMLMVLSVNEMSFICNPQSSPMRTPVKSAMRMPAVFLFKFM